jgi:hypothetical protein
MNNEYVSILINNNVYHVKFQNSKATVSLNNLKNGNYSVNTSFSSDIYEASNVNGSFMVFNYITVLEVSQKEFY